MQKIYSVHSNRSFLSYLSQVFLFAILTCGLSLSLGLMQFSGIAKVQAQGPSEAPVPVFPAGLITNPAPSFSWEAVAGARDYEFVLTDDTDAIEYFRQDRIAETTFSIVGAVFDQGKAYHWRVRAFDQYGEPSSWSEIESFLIYDPAAVPVLMGPVGYITTTTPVFEWHPVAQATSYELWILNESETETISRLGGLLETSYQQPSFAPFVPYVVYHYKVRSRGADGKNSIWSAPGSFMVYSDVDNVQLLSPQVSAPFGQRRFLWVANQGVVGYDFVLTLDDDHTVITEVAGLSSNEYVLPEAVPVENEVVYHWRVRSILAGGSRSIWSDPASFAYFDATAVPEPLLPFGYIRSSRPLLEWSQVSGAIAYEIEFNEAQAGLVLGRFVVNAGTVLPIYEKLRLQKEVVYTWRVRATLDGGRVSRWSEPRGFQINREPWEGRISGLKQRVPSYPQQQVSFFWQPLPEVSSGPRHYQVVLRLESDFDNIVTVWSGKATGKNNHSLELPADIILLPKAKYAWHVRAFNDDGNLVGVSSKKRFHTLPKVPRKFVQQVEQPKKHHRSQ